MRKKQEIKKGIAILRMKGDKISLLQAEVLENGHNESQVFATYVASVPEEDRPFCRRAIIAGRADTRCGQISGDG